MKLMKILEGMESFTNTDTKDAFSTLSDDFHIISKLNQLTPEKLKKVWKHFYQNRVFDYIDIEKVDWNQVLEKLKEDN